MKTLLRVPRLLTIAVGLALALPIAAQAYEMNSITCGNLRNPGQYGPYDYRTIPPDSKYLVESAHFLPMVENLQRSSSGGSVAGDLDYTLRAIPNQPRALLALTRLMAKNKSEQMAGMRYPAECYFDRAFRMAPDDAMPHIVYATYLKNHGRTADVKRQLDEAEKLRGDPSSFDLDYNLGLLYFDVGEYDKSAVAARRAYALGAPFPALMNKLKAAKRWPDKAAAPSAPVSAPQAADPPIVLPGVPLGSNN